ncbi:hypothetical protein PVAP13_1NG342519 [Panicum virgatum]|uniref:Uncharacterized protein n=1 Tax=Panicum virgatum TaxID=38727 RepID=A0A8T0X0F5_PANVG|nr:hypothetical protein PVAP13_1NG342519 [Panicum virgatum]
MYLQSLMIYLVLVFMMMSTKMEILLMLLTKMSTVTTLWN